MPKDYRNDGKYWTAVFTAAVENLNNNPNMEPAVAYNNAIEKINREYLGEDLFPNNKEL